MFDALEMILQMKITLKGGMDQWSDLARGFGEVKSKLDQVEQFLLN